MGKDAKPYSLLRTILELCGILLAIVLPIVITLNVSPNVSSGNIGFFDRLSTNGDKRKVEKVINKMNQDVPIQLFPNVYITRIDGNFESDVMSITLNVLLDDDPDYAMFGTMRWSDELSQYTICQLLAGHFRYKASQYDNQFEQYIRNIMSHTESRYWPILTVRVNDINRSWHIEKNCSL